MQIFHKSVKEPSKKEDLFTEEEIQLLNQCLDQELNRSVDQLMNHINKDQSQLFHNVNMEDYLTVFDDATNKPSACPTEEEFKQIQDHWLNMSQEEFEIQENNLLEWAAATL